MNLQRITSLLWMALWERFIKRHWIINRGTILPANFHETQEWKALARKHKAICRAKGMFYCVECKSTTELESAHCWPQKKYPEFALWLINLRLRCKDCNGRMGQRVYWDWQTLRVILYYAVRLCVWPTILITVGYAVTTQEAVEVFQLLKTLIQPLLVFL